MLRGETTTRSALDPESLVSRLQARGVGQLGVGQLSEEAAIWVALDGSDLRKPHASAMEHLQRVKRLAGSGTVPGYRTLNALGIGTSGRRGLLYHRLFSCSAATPPIWSASPLRRRRPCARSGRRWLRWPCR